MSFVMLQMNLDFAPPPPPTMELCSVSRVGWVDAVPTQHLPHQCVGLRKDATQPTTYTLSIDPANPNYLLEKSPSGKNKMAWADLVRVEYGKRYVYIYIDLSTALAIPVDKVKKGNLEQFAEQAEKMIERFA